MAEDALLKRGESRCARESARRWRGDPDEPGEVEPDSLTAAWEQGGIATAREEADGGVPGGED